MIGLHLDLKWPMYRREYLESVVGRAASLGMDTVLLEFENKIVFDWLKPAVHPEAWTARQVGAFNRLCRRRGLSVIPKVPLMGHMEWVLQWPWWAHLRENGDCREICPHHPEASAFLHRLLDAVLALFPDSPVIHLGGDETYSLGSCPRCRATGKTKGQVYLDHYLPLIRRVEQAGRRTMIYGDMILAHPEALDAMPRSVIIADWDYWSGEGKWINVWGHGGIGSAKDLDKLPEAYARYRRYFTDDAGELVDFPYAAYLKDQGFDVVLLSAAKCCGDNYCAPRTLMHVRNSLGAARRARQLDLVGSIVTSWAARFHHLETNWPSFAAAAWGYQDAALTIDRISERFAREFFGLSHPALFSVFDRLSGVLPDTESRHADPLPPDIVHRFIRGLYEDPVGESSRCVTDRLDEIGSSFQAGLRELERLGDKVRLNRDMYGHWLLAGRTLVHKAKAVPALVALVQGRMVAAARRRGLVDELDALTRSYRRVFGPTMGRVSLDMELRLRFEESRDMLLGR